MKGLTKYRVYEEKLNGGHTWGCFENDGYDEAEKLFDSLVSKGCEAVYLQELDLKFGWVTKTLKKHVTKAFDARKKAYWSWRAEEDESSSWRPGDASWNAPGMSVKDFI